MKIRMLYVIGLCCFTATLAMGADVGLEGTWITEGVPAVEAAKKARQSLSGLPEGTSIKFKVDTKKNKVSGTINQLNTDKEYDVEDGKLTDKTFTFKSVEVVSVSSYGNFGNSRGGGSAAPAAPAPISWKGELKDENTVVLTRLSATGEPVGNPLVLQRLTKKK